MTSADKKDYRKECHEHYHSIVSVYCPVLKERVHFNSDGFYHMIFKSNRERRNAKEQNSRLQLIPLIKPVLKMATRIDETRIEENKKMRGEKIETLFAVVAFVGKNKKAKVKVVIRKIGNGRLFFHSIMRLNNHTKNTP